MKRSEANEIMVKQFEELSKRAESVGEEFGDNEELVKITDCMHKLYITLSNAGAFDEDLSNSEPSQFSS